MTGQRQRNLFSVAINGLPSICAPGVASVDSGWNRSSGSSYVYESANGTELSCVEVGRPTTRSPAFLQLRIASDGASKLIAFGGTYCSSAVMYTCVVSSRVCGLRVCVFPTRQPVNSVTRQPAMWTRTRRAFRRA